MKKTNKKDISSKEANELIDVLKTRFIKNMHRHEGIDWKKVQSKLESNKEKLWSLNEMEDSGGEPDVVEYDKKTDEFFFTIAQRKVLKVAEAFVMIERHWIQEKKTNPKPM